MNKSPAFQLYVNDFLGSAKVGMMNGQEIGIYIMLLFLDWQEKGFELNDKTLSVWCRVSLEDFQSGWALIKKCFEKRRGRMYSPRLELERRKQEAWRKKSAKGGATTAAKWLKGGAQMVPTIEAPEPSTPFPFPLPITTTTTPNGGWPAEAAEVWKVVAPIRIPRLGKALKPVVDAYGWPATKLGLEAYIELNRGKTRKVEWFVDDAVRWLDIGKMPAIDPETLEPTERGRLALKVQ